jgi:hypothetical protein
MKKLSSKFEFTVLVEGKTLYIDLIRTQDGKSKRFTFNNSANPLVSPYIHFMNSLTDDQCQMMIKG